MSDTSPRFYKCYHNASHWICEKDSDALNESTLLDKDGGFLINKTLSIPSWIHVATDELVLSYRLRGPVSIKRPPYPYTHMSSGAAVVQKEAKSSG